MTTLVARVLAKLEPGGAQLSVLRVVRAIEAHGIASRVLVGWASPEGLALAARLGVEVEVYGDGGDQQWQADPGFARWLAPRLAGADVVHAHMFGGWWAATQALDADTPLVASEHNALVWPGIEPVLALRSGVRRIDRFFAHGRGARRGILAAGLPLALMREGVSPIAGFDSRPRAGLPSPRIVFAGRLHPEKGPDVLLAALALAPGGPPALVLGEGPLRDSLDRDVQRLGLADRVRMCGWQDRPGDWIAGASVLVVPSRDEAWSQTAVLGMGLGVPVIGTDVDGLPDTLADGRGIVVPGEDPVALAAAIGDVLSGHRTTDLLGARRYAQRFTAARVAASYATAYGELDGTLQDNEPTDAAGVGSVMSADGIVEPAAHDLHAWHVLRPLLDAGGYLPWSSGAMRPSGLVALCNEIVLGERRRVVELGSGVSTILLARLLREQGDGGTLDAVEHHAGWAEWVTARLAREGLETVARVTLAPLEDQRDGWDDLPWYASAPLHDALAGAPVELLLVDGPPAHEPRIAHARHPALPALLPFLADDAVVVLDDVIRPGERDVLERWERATPFRFERREPEAIAIGRRSAPLA